MRVKYLIYTFRTELNFHVVISMYPRPCTCVSILYVEITVRNKTQPGSSKKTKQSEKLGKSRSFNTRFIYENLTPEWDSYKRFSITLCEKNFA